MTVSTRLGLALLPAALALGILGDWLLRCTPWGVSVLLWVLAGLAGLFVLARCLGIAALGEGMWLAVPALLLSAGLAWRDSATLRALDLCGLLVCLALGAARTRSGRVRLAGILDYVVDGLHIAFQAAFGVFTLVFRDVEWGTIPRAGWLPRALSVVRGLVLALPLLLFFGGLLMAADAVYSRLISTALHFDVGALLNHLFFSLFLAWLAAGFGRALLLAASPALPNEKCAGLPSLGIVETTTIFSLLNLLFLSFVLVQIRYFFGGAATVQATTGLTYAQYARSGFFELVWVAALVLPLLLGLHWLQKPGDARAQRLFSWQAGVQVALLFVIMASALARMRLYEGEYGLTELRLYTTAFMGWLLLVFAWFTLTALRGRRERFAFGAAVCAFALVVALHVVNPDAMIVRADLAHAQKGRAFDAEYAASLSADAVPALTDALPALPVTAQGTLAARLLPLWSHDSGDWRSWSLARDQAFRAVQSRRADLLADQKFAPPGANCR